LHAIFNLSREQGLTTLLAENRPIAAYSYKELGHETEVPGVFVLPSGPASDNVSRLLNSARMIELLERLRNDFDTILLDTAPGLQFAHARVLGRLADAAILVLRAGRTERASAVAVANRFAEDNIPVLGTILNDFNPRAAGGYDYGYGSYYRTAD